MLARRHRTDMASSSTATAHMAGVETERLDEDPSDSGNWEVNDGETPEDPRRTRAG